MKLFVCLWMLLAAAEVPNISDDRVIALVNRFRDLSGIPPLKKDQRLTLAAQARADDMAARRYFAHINPDGKTPWEFMAEAGYSYRNAGENLATGRRTEEETQLAWQRSSGHRANQMNRKFTETGIGIARVPMGVVIVQIFASPLRGE